MSFAPKFIGLTRLLFQLRAQFSDSLAVENHLSALKLAKFVVATCCFKIAGLGYLRAATVFNEQRRGEFPFPSCGPVGTIPPAIFPAMDGEILMPQTQNVPSTNTVTSKSAVRDKRGSLPAVVLSCAILIPVVASAWYQNSDQSMPVLTISTSRPSLVFSTYLYHHGEQPVEPTSQLKTEFRFRNDGEVPVHIVKVERSCGCMNPMVSARDVDPGEIASLQVPISTINEQPGMKEFVLTVHYTDPEPQQANLTIKAVFPEREIVVEPKALFLSQRTNSQIPFSVRVSDFRDERLKVTSVTSTADFVDTVLIQSAANSLAPALDPAFAPPDFDEPESSKIQQVAFASQEQTMLSGEPASEALLNGLTSTSKTSATIEGSVQGDIPPGRHHVLIAAATSDPDYPMLTVPMMVTGPQYLVGQEVQMTSSVIQLVASEDSRARRQGRVAFTAPADWEFAEPKVWPEQLQVAFKTSPTAVPDRATTTVQVDLTTLPVKQLKEGVVSIATKDGKNLVTVKVSILWP